MDTGRILFTSAPNSMQLCSLESHGGVVVVDRHKRHRLVAGHRRDLAEHVALRPPRRGRRVCGPTRLAPLWGRGPEQSIPPHCTGGRGPPAAKPLAAVPAPPPRLVCAPPPP